MTPADTLANTPHGPAEIESRRVGPWGHFVMPLSVLAAELEAFIGAPVTQYLVEARAISRDDQGVHPEEAALLYLLARATRPQRILETGTFKGYSTGEFARAIHANGAGHLVTVDVSPETGDMVPHALRHHVTFHRGAPSSAFAASLAQDERFQIFFHDSLHTFCNTLGELTMFAEHYADGATLLCHDAKMDYMDGFGVGKAVRLFAQVLGLEYRILDTTCGLAVLKWPGPPPAQALQRMRELRADCERQANEPLWRKAARRVLRLQ